MSGPANAATVTIYDNADIAHTVTTTITVTGTSPSGPTTTTTGNFFQPTAGTTIYEPSTRNLVGGSTAIGYVGSYTTTVVVPGTSTTVTQVTSTPATNGSASPAGATVVVGSVTGSAITIPANTNQDVSKVRNIGIYEFTSYSSLAQATGRVDLLSQKFAEQFEPVLQYRPWRQASALMSAPDFIVAGSPGYFIDANDYSGAE